VAGGVICMHETALLLGTRINGRIAVDRQKVLCNYISWL